MLPTSQAFRDALRANSSVLLKATLTLADSTDVSLVGSDFTMGGLSFTSATSSGSGFDVGAVVVGTCDVTLANYDGRFDDYDFTAATIVPYVGKDVGAYVEWLQIGVYNVEQPDSYGATINLHCYDNLGLLDQPYSDVPTQYPATLLTIARDICTTYGLTLGTASFPNGDYAVSARPAEAGLTSVGVLGFVAQAAGCFVRCDDQGRPVLTWYDADAYTQGGSGADATLDRITSLTTSTDDVVVTGVSVTAANEVTLDGTVGRDGETHLYGSPGYVLGVRNNPLIEYGHASTVAGRIGPAIAGMRFRPLQANGLASPAWQAGDAIEVTDQQGRTYQTYATSVTWTAGSYAAISCTAKTPARNSAAGGSAITQAIVDLRKAARAEKTAREAAIRDVSAQIAAASGLYETEVVQPDQSVIYYLHDHPDLADSDIVWRMSAEVMSVSTDGGQTFTAALTATGDAILQRVYAIGIDATYIDTGRIQVGPSASPVFSADFDTGTVQLGMNVPIGGKTAAEIAGEAVDSLTLSSTNLIRNGDFTNGTEYWNGTGVTVTAQADADFGYVLKSVQSGAGGSSYRCYPTTANFTHETGKTYSVSFWAKANASNTLYCNRAGSTTAANSYVRGEAIGTTWHRYTGTITAASTGAINFWLGSAGTLYLADVMVVEGDKPMLDWGPDPRDALVPVDQWLTQSETFNRLTNNGALQGLYMSNNELYVNATYIKTGYLNASRIQGGTLKLGGGSNGNGVLEVYDASNTKIGTINNAGANLTGDVTLKKQVTVTSGVYDVAETLAGSIGAGALPYLVISGVSGADNNSRIAGLKVSNKSTSDSIRATIMLAPQRTSNSGARSAIFTTGEFGLYSGIGDNKTVTAGSFIQLNTANISMYVRGASEISYNTNKGMRLTTEKLTLGAHLVSASNTLSLDVGGTGYIHGALTVNGTKSRCVETDGYNTRLLYCDETPMPMFTDVGGGVTDGDGECVVMVDPIFAEAARTDLAYHVFLQPCGEGTLHVAEKAAGYFVVKGTANLPFDWQLKARQLGYESERLEDMDMRDERDAMGGEDTSIEELYADEFAGLFDADDMYDMDTYEDEEEAA